MSMRISDVTLTATSIPVRVERRRETGPRRRLLDFARSERWVLLPLALAACSEPKPDHSTLAKVEAEQKAIRDEDGRILCAQGQADITRSCTVDREQTDAGLVLTVRHPDGAFHRLLVTKDGRGVIAADGAEQAQVTVRANSEIEVALGGDRYRLPATVRP